MSVNFQSGNSELSQVIQLYKEMHKTSGADVESLHDAAILTMFMVDADDGKIDGIDGISAEIAAKHGDEYDGKLMNGFNENVTDEMKQKMDEMFKTLGKDKIKILANEYLDSLDQVDPDFVGKNDIENEFPLDKEGGWPGEIQEKIGKKYKSIEEFDKDIKAGKFNYVSKESLESARRLVSDKEMHEKFPTKGVIAKEHSDRPTDWDAEIQKKVVDFYKNLQDFDNDVKNNKFYFVSEQSLAQVRAEIAKKSAA